MRTCEVAIIGAGPAGVAAAIQLSRFGVEIALFEKDSVGGLIRNANKIENYPGYPNGLSGPDFVHLLEEHLQKLKIEVISENIEHLSYDGDNFTLQSESGSTTAARVIVASGTIPITLPQIPSSLTNKVFHEVYPLRKIKDCAIAIIGGGDAAFDYGLNLARHNDISILIRDDSAKCLPLLLERSKSCEQIRVQLHTVVESIDETNENIQLTCRKTDISDTFQLDIDYLLIAIGRRPNLDFIDDKLRNRMNDLIDGSKLYMIGDVGNGLYRQATIAVGDGIKAAMSIFRSLTGEQV